jgi:hypothetical protein
MGLKVMSILVMVWFMCTAATAQTEREITEETTVCDVVAHPLQFKGKRIRVRALIWSDIHKSWLNESWAGSKQIGKVCRWLPAEFTYPTNLIASSAFGTFTGRLVYEPGPAKGSVLVRFVVENQSDIYGQKEQNGMLVDPLLYDWSTKRFYRPE